MALRLGSSTPTKFYLGSIEVAKAYTGASEVYSSAPAPAAWTPAELGASLTAWLDAEDASTITLNGSTVSQWSDKSGNNRNATQATATAQPLYAVTGFNGKPTVQFDGTSDFMSANAVGSAIGSNSFVILAACRFPTSASAGTFMLSMREASGGLLTRGYVLRRSAAVYGTDWGDPAAPPPNVAIADGAQSILGARRNGSAVSNLVNGVETSTVTPVFRSPFGLFALGAFGTGISNTDVHYSEVVVATGAMTLSDRQKLEGYLAWKWGLAESLPADHPYRWDGTLFGGPKLWRPDELGTDLTLWLDAADASTITLNGSTVSQWSDKSASAAHVAQATAASQPLYTASGLNGKPVVTFSGAQRLNSVLTTLVGGTVAAVSQRSASTQPVFEVSPTSSRGYQGNAVGFQSHNAYRVNGGTATTSVFPTAIAGSPALSVATDRRTATAISHSIGHGTPGFVPLIGFISEIVSTETILSTDNRQKLEGYLAHKWGLEANLPADHPYKTTPPTV